MPTGIYEETFEMTPMRWLPVLLGCVLLCACNRDDSRTVVVSPDRWVWEAEYFVSSEDDRRFWDTSLDRVEVEVEGEDFEGEIRVRIYDDVDAKIFDETYEVSGPQDFEVTENSSFGVPGLWRIDIDATAATGQIWIELDPVE